ncbi:MAG TPA: non-canonical purine NTP pyrophosphatase [Myxococcota bacterium]|nr:non-canonical purine NTP pyrophosphatase [Myxococcota bacterium]
MSRKFNEEILVIASHNQGKISEIALMLEPFGIALTSAKELKLPVPEETGKTYLENALLKARACAAQTSLPALADDSGVEVAALHGLPGLDTAPYTELHGGHQAVFAMWAKNPDIMANPKASFKCVQVLAWPDGHYEHFLGEVEGRLTFPPRGKGGHGYDPIFIPAGHKFTAAEMTTQEKNAYSHRSLSLNALIDACIK